MEWINTDILSSEELDPLTANERSRAGPTALVDCSRTLLNNRLPFIWFLLFKPLTHSLARSLHEEAFTTAIQVEEHKLLTVNGVELGQFYNIIHPSTYPGISIRPPSRPVGHWV